MKVFDLLKDIAYFFDNDISNAHKPHEMSLDRKLYLQLEDEIRENNMMQYMGLVITRHPQPTYIIIVHQYTFIIKPNVLNSDIITKFLNNVK